MEDNFFQFFKDTDFDIYEPHSGHLYRFEKKLTKKKAVKISWKWFSVAASVVLLIGFWLGNLQQKKIFDLADISPKMKEVQQYFVVTINQEIKEIERYRSLNTEKIIERALDELEELEDNYQVFVNDLSKNGNQRRIVRAMINNYQQRLHILQNLLDAIEQIKSLKNNKHEHTIS